MWCRRSWLSKQMSLQPPLKRVQWQAAVTQCWWQTVPHCGPMEGEAALAHRRLYCTLGRLTHPVYADHSRGLRPSTLSISTQNSCRYGGATRWIHFHTWTAVLKMILRRTGSQWRLRRTGVTWSRRHAPDTYRAAVFCTDCSRFIRVSLHRVKCNERTKWSRITRTVERYILNTMNNYCMDRY